MRIAFVLCEFPQLSETFILNQITGLIDLGYNVDIFAEYDPKNLKRHKDVEKYHLLDRTYYLSMRSKRFIKTIRVFFALTSKLLKNPGLIKKTLKMIRDDHVRFFPYKLLLFLSLYKKYDIVHFHFGDLSQRYCIYLKKHNLKAKVITSFYGYDITSLIFCFGKDFYNRLIKCGDLFLPICTYFKKQLINVGFDEKKIRIHPLAIDTDIFLNNTKNQIESSKLCIITVARFQEKKGHKYSIKAVKELISKGYNIEYILIGSGPFQSDIEDLIKELKLENVISLKGDLTREEIINYLKEAHIFLLTSITDSEGNMEGTPTVLLEAQAMGIPVVSTIHSGIPEIVSDGNSGYLVPEKDIDATVEKLEYLINNPEKRIEMGKFGRKFISENFDIKILSKKLVNIYKSALID